MAQNYQNGFYGYPQQPQNVYQQMGIPQPQAHLNLPIQYNTQPKLIQPPRYTAFNPPTSSFPNQQKPQIMQTTQPQSRPLPAPLTTPTSRPIPPTPSPSRPLPTPGQNPTHSLPLKTPVQHNSSSPPKRRQSPPKFNNPSSRSSSPTKPATQSIPKITSTTPSTITALSASASPPKPSSISSSSSSTVTDNHSPKQPQVWKRTIPEVPAPVWGYAAGLVAHPHPMQTPRTQAEMRIGDSSAPSSPKKTGVGYSSKQKQQRSPAHQYVGQTRQAQGPFSRTSAIIGRADAVGFGSNRFQEHDQDTDSVTTEETEETEEEEETGEEDASDPAPTLNRFRQVDRRPGYHPLAEPRTARTSGGIHRREDAYRATSYDYEDDDTPKKRGSKAVKSGNQKTILRPKVKIDPYGGYEDVSPIGYGGRKKVRPRSETEDVGRRMFDAMDSLGGAHGKGKMLQRIEAENATMRPGHRRAYSAIGQRELSTRNRNWHRDVASDYTSDEDDEVQLAYEDVHEYVKVNDRRRVEQDERRQRPQSQPNVNSNYVDEERTISTRLPQPPAMFKDRDGGGLISHSQPEKRIRGGPRSILVNHVGEEEYSPEGRNWPGDLPRLPLTPGGGSRTGYFDSVVSKPDLNLDDPPPPRSIVRTPSPGVAGGYVLQKREDENHTRSRSAGFETALRRFEVDGRTQVQQRVYASKVDYPSPMTTQSQVRQHQRQSSHGMHHFPQQGRYVTTPRKQQQTPAPFRPAGIESPYPVGGRDKMADMNKLEPSEKGADVMRLRGGPISNVPSVPTVTVEYGDMDSMRHDIPNSRVPTKTERRPLPASPGSRSNSRPQSTAIGHSFGEPPQKPASTSVFAQRDLPRPHSIASSAQNFKPDKSSRNEPPATQVFDVPGVFVSKPVFDDDDDDTDNDGGGGGIIISVTDQDEKNHTPQRGSTHPLPASHYPVSSVDANRHSSHPVRSPSAGNSHGGLICSGCHGGITHGRILSAMGLRWHPPCFKCSVCSTLLEHVSSYENDGKPYCHLDYHEAFAPRCYSCNTAIIDEQFISLDDSALGKRTYHTQHFFCSECGDPFLDPSVPLSTDENGELALSGDGEFEGFTVYKGYPYCEACHVRLRLPKCKGCKKAIRDHHDAVEALGGKWCWSCFVCASCSEPFQDPSFFQRGNQPYCESCFSIILRNEI